ncbi:Tankyrase-1 [Drechslerella dactyloides]|uniref:Tankyrase-1 n=1 Tax=Drechslerella dactyloides TaxID=74499 RepID=A0AAD6IPB7_DREDA|nr:Tankyrase-1 [Drechslerella dactyloides]
MTVEAAPQPQPDSPCWAKAKQTFLENILAQKKRPSQENIDRFLKEDFRLDKAIAKCQTLKTAAENQYSKGKGSKFVGKLLEVLTTVKEVADPFLQFAPESVSIAWSCVSFLIQVGASDLENCGLIAEACTSIATVILNCRLYETRYAHVNRFAGDRDTEMEIMNAIPNILVLVLDFSWYTQNRLSEHKILRSFKETFNPKLKEKYEELQEEYKKLRSIAGDAFQERVMDIMDHVTKRSEELRMVLFPALDEIRSKLEDISDIKQILSEREVRDQFARHRASLNPTDTHEQQLNIVLNPLSHETDNLCQWLFQDESYIKWETNPVRKTADASRPSEAPYKTSESIHVQKMSVSAKELTVVEESEKPPRICYIKGQPGFGKSVTVACALGRLSKPERKCSVCYFFFKQGDEATEGTRTAISSLAAQLFSDKTATTKADMERFNAVMKKIREADDASKGEAAEGSSGNGVLSNSTLKKLVEELGKVHGKPIYLVIDAIDECVDYEAEELIPWLLKLARSTETDFKVLFSSRDSLGLQSFLTTTESSEDAVNDATSESGSEDDSDDDDSRGDDESESEQSRVSNGGVVKLDDSIIYKVTQKTNSADMEAYLTSSLQKLVLRRMKDYKFRGGKRIDVSPMVAGIKRKANGMFTYSAMVVASLGQPSSLSLSARLRVLPDGMDELYRRRLEALTTEERKLITLALKRIVWSVGDIGTVEIAEQFKELYEHDKNEDDDELYNLHEEKELDDAKPREQGTLDVGHDDEPAISVIGEDGQSDDEDDMHPWQRAYEDALNDPEIADTIYHLEQAGRDFFQFSADKRSVDVIHKSVRDWVENESRRAAERDGNKVSLTSLFAWDDKTQSLKLSLPIPGSFVQSQTTTVDFQSEQECHLDIALYILRTLNNPKFQDRYMPNVSKPHEEGGDDGEGDAVEKGNEEGDQEEDSSTRGDAAEVPNTQDADELATENGSGAGGVEIGVEGEAADTAESEAEEDDGDDGDDAASGTTATEDMAAPTDLAGIMLGNRMQHRYEVIQWIKHLKRLQELVPPKDRAGQKWDALWKEIQKFFEPATFRRWTVQYAYFAFGILPQDGVPFEVHPIHLMAFFGLTMVIEYLLNVLKIEPNILDDDGDTPLQAAYANPQMVELLLKHGADVMIRGGDNKNALDRAMNTAELRSQDIDLESITVKDSIKVIKLLVEAGADINDASEMPKKLPPLHIAIAIGDLELFNLFMRHNADVTKTDIKSATALHKVFMESSTASGEDRFKMAKALVEAGADVNAEDIDSTMPLFVAVSWQNKQGVKLLLKHGADVLDENLRGVQAIHEAASPRSYKDDEAALDIIDMLLAKGADLNATTKSGGTPLMLALEEKYLSLFEALIEKGLEKSGGNKEFLMKGDFDGENLLHLVTRLDDEERPDLRTEAVDIICKYLSKEDVTTLLEEKETNWSFTPLLAAADKGKIDLVQRYIDLGSNIHAEDADGDNVLHLVFRNWITESFDSPLSEETEGLENMMVSVIQSDASLLKDHGVQYLHRAVERRSESLVRALVNAGVDVLAEDESGWSSMDLAVGSRLILDEADSFAIAITEYEKSTFANKTFKPPTKLSSTKKSHHLVLSDDGLTVKEDVMPREDDGDGIVSAAIYADFPVSPKDNFFYFEVTLSFKDPSNNYIAIGLVADPCPTDAIPGLTHCNTVAYAWHGNDGLLFYSKEEKPFTLGNDEQATFQSGDVIGCGWNKISGEIFYTKNGKYVDVAWSQVPCDKLWPAIGSKAEYEANVNFGQDAFKWGGLEDMKRQTIRKDGSDDE